jgi:CheY-like chemotaxis protein
VIVDDNQDASELLADALIGLGHDVRVAHDGPSGLSRVTEVVPDVAFLDLGLPGMDGYELARRLRLQPGLERVRLVALTGYGDPAARLRSAAAGFDEHLVKPASLARIAEAIDRGAAAPGAAR